MKTILAIVSALIATALGVGGTYLVMTQGLGYRQEPTKSVWDDDGSGGGKAKGKGRSAPGGKGKGGKGGEKGGKGGEKGGPDKGAPPGDARNNGGNARLSDALAAFARAIRRESGQF